MTFKIINPLNSSYIDDRPGLYRACVNGDAKEWRELESMLHWLKPSLVKSPAQQFDESHKKWLEGGREC